MRAADLPLPGRTLMACSLGGWRGGRVPFHQGLQGMGQNRHTMTHGTVLLKHRDSHWRS